MELKDFVSTSIEQISRGIMEAGENLKNTDAIVSPEDFRVNSDSSQAFGRTKNDNVLKDIDAGTRVVQKVDFDIALTVDESQSKTAGAKISVLSIGIGAEGGSESTTGTVSRLQFSVPVVFPSCKA